MKCILNVAIATVFAVGFIFDLPPSTLFQKEKPEILEQYWKLEKPLSLYIKLVLTWGVLL